MAERAWLFKTLTESGVVTDQDAIFHGFVVATDGTNDTEAEVHVGETDAGAKPFPTITAKGTEGFAGAVSVNAKCPGGIYLKLTPAGGGTCEATVYYTRG